MPPATGHRLPASHATGQRPAMPPAIGHRRRAMPPATGHRPSATSQPCHRPTATGQPCHRPPATHGHHRLPASHATGQRPAMPPAIGHRRPAMWAEATKSIDVITCAMNGAQRVYVALIHPPTHSPTCLRSK